MAVSSTCFGAAIMMVLLMLATVMVLPAVILVTSLWLWLLTLPVPACSLMPVSLFGSSGAASFLSLP